MAAQTQGTPAVPGKGLLRFITCGSVDDGKSTLLGRLLYDTKLLFDDQLAALEGDSLRHGTQNGELDFALLVRDDDRVPLEPGEKLVPKMVRFRTLGCWPLTAAVESDAADLDGIIGEMLDTRESERAGRIIDLDPSDSMERKKREGYF